MEKKLYIAMAALSLVAIIFSVVILAQENARHSAQPATSVFLTDVQNLCTMTKSDCEAVQESEYGKTFGIENAYLGIFGFSLLLIFIVLQLLLRKSLLKATVIVGTLIGGIMSARFLYIQAFILRHHCIYCLVVDIIGVLLLVLKLVIVAKLVGLGAKKHSRHKKGE
jgi:uncharacterized membrane protein